MSHERTITVSDKGQRISTLTKVSVIVFENGLIRLSMTEHLEDAWAKRPKRTAIDIMLMPDEAEALGLGLDIPQQAAQAT